MDKIAFTGSTEVGRIIRRATAGSGKKLSLELGGKSPFIVFEDADLDSVVEGVVDAIWFNQGQVCCAGSRLLVQEGVADQLIGKLRARMETLRVGSPLDKAVDMGAIVAPVQLARIKQLVEQGVTEGAAMWQPSWACPTDGYFYPPTLFTDVEPASTIAQVEIFGPVLVAMTFRTPAESVALANNTPYGLAASVWTENINLALDIAPKIKAGVVWINSTNMFDASAGFGGYRESGFGREGGREGMWEYLKADWEHDAPERPSRRRRGHGAHRRRREATGRAAERRSDRRSCTSAASRRGPTADIPARSPGRRGGSWARWGKGIARTSATRWRRRTRRGRPGRRPPGHLRAQILYYIAENLSAREDEFATRIVAQTGVSRRAGAREVQTAISRLFTYAAWADKYDGAVHNVPIRGVALAMHEPIGVIGIACPNEHPLLGFVSLMAPAVATGNTVVMIPSEAHPLSATDFYGVLDTSDVPAGVVNIVTGATDALARVLAEHDDVEADVVFRFTRRRAHGGTGVGVQHEAHLVLVARTGLDARNPGRGARVPPGGDPGEEYLDSVRGMKH